MIEKRKVSANRLHRKYYDRRFNPQIWYRALSIKSDNEQEAKRWIEDQGAHAQQIKYAQLVRHLVLERVRDKSDHESTDGMFNNNCMFYCSGHQFVILVPPRTSPWCQNSDKWLGRVYGLKDGEFIQDTNDVTLKNQATRACVDPLKDLIWFDIYRMICYFKVMRIMVLVLVFMKLLIMRMKMILKRILILLLMMKMTEIIKKEKEKKRKENKEASAEERIRIKI